MLCFVLTLLTILLCRTGVAQEYHVIKVQDGGTITGTVKWSGPEPHSLTFPITKDPQICDPDSKKRADLQRLIIGSNGGVANTVIFLSGITKGKAMDLPEPQRFLDQRHCRYEPHILLVPQNENLRMKSSDATLHTIHMEGAATYNLPFPFPDKTISRTMSTPGMVTLRCNGGHVWMNAEMFVAQHPYYAVTDESGHFELTDVPAGDYDLVAWHEGWNLARKEATHDVLTQQTVARPVFTEPRTWHKHVAVNPRQSVDVAFTLSEK
jgi:hypothetical protein